MALGFVSRHRCEKKNILPEKILPDTLYGGDENVVNAQRMGVDVVSPVPGSPPKKEPLKLTIKQLRLKKRREEQETKEWRKGYNPRAQIKGTIGSVKRRTSMVRLRYRGKDSSFYCHMFEARGLEYLPRAQVCPN